MQYKPFPTVYQFVSSATPHRVRLFIPIDALTNQAIIEFMKSLGTCLLLAFLVFFSSSSFAAITNDSDRLSAEATTNFEWFSHLGFPDVKGCPLVHVATGGWYQSGNEPPQNQYLDAFLLSSNAHDFTVFTTDLSKHTFTYTTNGTPEYERVSFEPRILNDEVSLILTNHLDNGWEQDLYQNFGASFSTRMETFILAWACWRQGLDSEATNLYQHAVNTRRTNTHYNDPDFHTRVEKDVAYAMIWRSVLNFEDPSISRPELLAPFQAIVKNYPDSEYHLNAQDTVQILTRMIAEDATHQPIATTNFLTLPVEDQVNELIYQLRDQNGHQWSQPGWCDIFLDPRGTNSPAAQLVKIGYPAVPQLIDTLDDSTLTRSVGYWRNFAFSHTVLTVGDCAQAILGRIAGRSFYEPASTSGYMSNEDKSLTVRAAAEAWWSEFQEKGEKQMLIEETEAGDRNSPAEARLLVDRYPQRAVEPLIKGMQNSTDDWVKTCLLQLLGNFDSPDALAFLGQTMREGSNSPCVCAAEILNQKGKQEAVSVMIKKWNQTSNTNTYDTPAQFLANANSSEAINALEQNLAHRPLSTRMAVVNLVGESGTWTSGGPTNRSDSTLKALEDFLVTELQDDDQEVKGGSSSRMGISYIDPRVFDMAGFYLNQRWPNRYHFDLSASLKVRETQRIQCENIWRQAHNLEPLPLPETTNHVSTGEAAKVVAIDWQTNSVKPSAVFLARVENFKNHQLTATDVVDLITNYSSNPEEGTSGLVFQLRKDEDLTGVRLSVSLLPGTVRDRQFWQFIQDALLGKGIIDSQGGEVFASESRSWKGLANDINNSVAASPETPFVIKVKLYSDN